MEVVFGKGRVLCTLYFADDQMVMTGDEDDLSYMLRKLKEDSAVTGLRMNISKSD